MRTLLAAGVVMVVAVLFGMSVAAGFYLSISPRECGELCYGDVWAWTPVSCACVAAAAL